MSIKGGNISLQMLITDFGLSVHYSQGGVTSIKVTTEWRNILVGMCGTCNNNAEDEMTLPDGSQVGLHIFLKTIYVYKYD